MSVEESEVDSDEAAQCIVGEAVEVQSSIHARVDKIEEQKENQFVAVDAFGP